MVFRVGSLKPAFLHLQINIRNILVANRSIKFKLGFTRKTCFFSAYLQNIGRSSRVANLPIHVTTITNITYLSPNSLGPVKHTTRNLHARKPLPQRRPDSHFVVDNDALNSGLNRQHLDDCFKHRLVVLFLFAGHEGKHQWNLLGVIFGSHESVDGDQLCKRMATELKGTVYIPTLGSGKHIKLLIGGKYEVTAGMATTNL